MTLLEIFGDSLHFDMAGPPDEDDVEAFGRELHCCFVNAADERTRCVDQAFAGRGEPAALAPADPVRRDEDGRRRRQTAAFTFRGHSETLLPQLDQNAFVVHQFAVNGDIGRPIDLCGRFDGIAHAEAHAERSCAKDFHWLTSCLAEFQSLCRTKLLSKKNGRSANLLGGGPTPARFGGLLRA